MSNGCYIHFVAIHLARNDPFDAISVCFLCVFMLYNFSLRELECVALSDLIFYLLCVVWSMSCLCVAVVCFLSGDCPFVHLVVFLLCVCYCVVD